MSSPSFITHPDQVTPGMLLNSVGRGALVKVLYISYCFCACKSIGDQDTCKCVNDSLNIPKVPTIHFNYFGRNPRTGEVKLYENGDPIVWDGKYSFTLGDEEDAAYWDSIEENLKQEASQVDNEKVD